MPYSLLKATGLSIIEKNEDNQNIKWRWALGPETQLTFKLLKQQPLRLNFSFSSLMNNQTVNIDLNGTPIETAINLNKSAPVSKTLVFQGVAGLNTITFKYKDWNKNRVEFIPNDDRAMAVQFTQLAIATEAN